MSNPIRTYVIAVDGGLLGLERVIGLLRRRRITVLSLAVHPAENAERSRLVIRVSSRNHEQVRRQIARVQDVAAQTDLEERSHDDAA